MVRVHVGLDLKDKATKLRLAWLDLAVLTWSGSGGGGELDKALQEPLDPKVGDGAAKEQRRDLPCRDSHRVEWLACDIEQLNVLTELLRRAAANNLVESRIA